jgi:hypothetical protein
MHGAFWTTEREKTENYLLTLASRLGDIKGVVVLVIENDDRYTNHQANYDNVPWANVAGNLALVQNDILSNKLSWTPVQLDGSAIEEEEP